MAYIVKYSTQPGELNAPPEGALEVKKYVYHYMQAVHIVHDIVLLTRQIRELRECIKLIYHNNSSDWQRTQGRIQSRTGAIPKQ